MCEIYVTHRCFSQEFLSSLNVHRISERGRGFALIYENRITLLRDLDAERVTQQYVRHARTREPLVTILHQRVPTHGDISIENTQPFASNERVFAHNGMLSTETYHVLRAVFPNLKDASDSRLLWEVVRDLAWDDAVQLLRILGDRFVLADIKRKRIALVGSWEWDSRRKVWDRGFFRHNYILLAYDARGLEVVEAEKDQYHHAGRGWARFTNLATGVTQIVYPSKTDRETL
jgi:hypothetical protein